MLHPVELSKTIGKLHYLIAVHKGNTLRFKQWRDSPYLTVSNAENTPLFARSLNTEVRVVKAGWGSYSLNIRYLVNGKIVFLDTVVTNRSVTIPSNDTRYTDLISNIELLRMTSVECEQLITLQSTSTDLKMITSSGNPFYYHCIDRNILFIGYRKISDGATYQHIFFFPSEVSSSVQNSQSSKLDSPFNASSNAVFPLITQDSLTFETLDPDYYSHPIAFQDNIIKSDMTVTRGNFEPAPILNSSILGANCGIDMLPMGLPAAMPSWLRRDAMAATPRPVPVLRKN